MWPSTILSTMIHFPLCIKYRLEFVTSLHCKNWGLVLQWALHIPGFVQDWHLPYLILSRYRVVYGVTYWWVQNMTHTQNFNPILWYFRSDWKGKHCKSTSIYALSRPLCYYPSSKLQLKRYILITLLYSVFIPWAA